MIKKAKEELEKKAAALPPQMPEADLLKERLAEKEKTIEEQKNKYLRALADLENYKKRASLERDEFVRFSNESLVRELLPALDGLNKAMEYASSAKNEELVKGLALVKKLIEDSLKKFGVQEVESLGKPYDPNLHEAILMKDSQSQPGIVLEEVQKGYTIHGRLLRPSMVIVSKKEGGK